MGTNFCTPHPGAGFVPSVNQYSNARARDAFSFAALGRVELDTRSQLTNTFNTTAGTSAPRETTILNKAFIQFDGLTAGYAQSMFDFYANAYNFSNLRGSQATVALLAYTVTFGDGFSATLSAEDQASRRTAIGSTIASTTAAAITIGGVSATSFQAQPAGSRVPEIVGNLRLDQPWGGCNSRLWCIR